MNGEEIEDKFKSLKRTLYGCIETVRFVLKEDKKLNHKDSFLRESLFNQSEVKLYEVMDLINELQE
jgi:hypothetical protein